MLKLTRNHVLVETYKEEISSIIITPDSTDLRPFSGRVLAAGPDVREVCVGDTVHWGDYEGVELSDTQRVFREDELLAVEYNP